MVKTPIYFDHAATTPLCEEAFEKMKPYFTENFGNANSQHCFGREAVKAVDEARDTIASIINCKPGELYFSSERKAITGRFAELLRRIKIKAST